MPIRRLAGDFTYGDGPPRAKRALLAADERASDGLAPDGIQLG